MAVGGVAVASGLLDDVADGMFEYVDSDDGARRVAWKGDVGIFDDVHGHGSVWSLLWRGFGASVGCAIHRCRRRSGMFHGRGLVLASVAGIADRGAPANHRAGHVGRGTSAGIGCAAGGRGGTD